MRSARLPEGVFWGGSWLLFLSWSLPCPRSSFSGLLSPYHCTSLMCSAYRCLHRQSFPRGPVVGQGGGHLQMCVRACGLCSSTFTGVPGLSLSHCGLHSKHLYLLSHLRGRTPACSPGWPKTAEASASQCQDDRCHPAGLPTDCFYFRLKMAILRFVIY